MNTFLSTNPKYSLILATMKKINSIPMKTSTGRFLLSPVSLSPFCCAYPMHNQKFFATASITRWCASLKEQQLPPWKQLPRDMWILEVRESEHYKAWRNAEFSLVVTLLMCRYKRNSLLVTVLKSDWQWKLHAKIKRDEKKKFSHSHATVVISFFM